MKTLLRHLIAAAVLACASIFQAGAQAIDNEIPTTAAVAPPPSAASLILWGNAWEKWPPALWPLPDGKHLAIGDFSSVNGVSRPGLARLDADFELDASFNPPADLPRVSLGEPLTRVPKLLIADSGFFLISSEEGRLIRLRIDGEQDATFQPPFPDGYSKFALQGDGTLWCLRSNSVLHLATNGSVVTSTPIPTALAGQHIVALHPGGRLLAAHEGEIQTPNGSEWLTMINRWSLDGTRDPSFLPLQLPHYTHLAEAEFAVLPDGRLVSQESSEERGAVLRLFTADGKPDPNFPPAKIGLGGPTELDYSEGRLRSIGGFSARFFGQDVSELHLGARPKTALAIGGGAFYSQESLYRITCVRLGSSQHSASMRYATRDVTAIAGEDYVAQSGILSFAPLEVEKTVEVPSLRRTKPDNLSPYFELVMTQAQGIEAVAPPRRIYTTDDGAEDAPYVIRVQRLRDGRMLVHGTQARFEFSDDLKVWRPVPDIPDGRLGYRDFIRLDASATNAPTRYYRATTR